MVAIRFRPQAWVNDTAIDVDPFDETTCNMPDEVIKGIAPRSQDADELVKRPEAPAWWRTWASVAPFEVEW